MLLVGLVLGGVATVTRSAQAPQKHELSLKNLILKQIVSGVVKIKESDFKNLRIDLQNQIIAELLEINDNNVCQGLLSAAKNNLSWAIQPLLDRNADINFADQDGNTALTVAACCGHTATVEALLAAGVNACWISGRLGMTALMMAVVDDHTEVVKVLLRVAEVRQQIDACDELGETVLMQAVFLGRTGLVEILIDAGANPDVMCRVGWTALMMAAESGHVAIVKILIGGGAHINMVDRLIGIGMTALMRAASAGNIAGVNVLIDVQAALDITSAGGKTALMMAAERGYVAIVEMLIIAGASIDAVNTISGKTALMYAAEGRYMHACEESYTAAVEALLAAGANPCCIGGVFPGQL